MREFQQQFIDEMYPYAEKVAREFGVSPEVVLAQVAQETGWGQRVQEGTNNLFNIKAGSDWEGPTRALNALEYEGGVAVREPSDFRVYDSPEQSFDDYRNLINKPHFEQARMAQDDRGFVEGLQQGGYATDPEYADNIMRIRDQLMPSDEGYAPVTQAEYQSPPAEPGKEYFLASDQGMDPWDRMAMRFAGKEGDLGDEESQQGFVGDMVDAFQGGVYGSVGSLAELSEQLFGVGGGIRDWAYEGKDAQFDSFSDQSRESFVKEFFTEDEEGRFAPGDGLTDPRSWALQVADLTGQMASILVGGGGSIGLGARGVAKVSEKAAVKQLTRKAAAFKKANKGKELPKNLTDEAIERQGKLVNRVARYRFMDKHGDKLGYSVYGVMGGGVAQGQGATQAREEALALDKDTLMQSEHFRELLAEQDPNLSEAERFEAAHIQFSEDAAYAVATDPTLGAVNVLTGAFGTKYLDDLLTGSKVARSWYGRMGKGAGVEGSSEALQEGGAQRAVNLAIDDLGVERDEWEGVPQAAATGATLGAVLGGGGGAINTKGADPETKAGETEPGDADQTPPQETPPANAAEAAEQNAGPSQERGDLDLPKSMRGKGTEPTGKFKTAELDFPSYLRNKGFSKLSPVQLQKEAAKWAQEMVVEPKAPEPKPVDYSRREKGQQSREVQNSLRQLRETKAAEKAESEARAQKRKKDVRAAIDDAEQQKRKGQRAEEDALENHDYEAEALKAEAEELKRLEALYSDEIRAKGPKPRKRSSKAGMKRIIKRFKINLARRVERGEVALPEHSQAGAVTNTQMADKLAQAFDKMSDDVAIADLEAKFADMVQDREQANANSQTGFNESNASAAAQTLSSKAKRKQWLKELKQQRGDVPAPVWAQLNAEVERQISADVMANGVGDIPANTMAEKLKAALAKKGNGKTPTKAQVKEAVTEAVTPAAPATKPTNATKPTTPTSPGKGQVKTPKPKPKQPDKPTEKRTVRGWMMTRVGKPAVEGMDRNAVAAKAQELFPNAKELDYDQYQAAVKATKEKPPEPPKPPKKPVPKKPKAKEQDAKPGRPQKDKATRVRKAGVPKGFKVRETSEGQFYIEDPDGDRVEISGFELFSTKDMAEGLLLRESDGKANWKAWMDSKAQAPATTPNSELSQALVAVAKAKQIGSPTAADKAKASVTKITDWAKSNMDPKDGAQVMKFLLSRKGHEWQTAIRMVADRAGISAADLHKFFSMENEIDSAPAKGMMKGAAETVSRHWLNRFNGAAGARVRVVQSQSELTDVPPGKIVRAYWDNGEVVLVADNLTSAKDVEAALRHEILVHHGLKTVLPAAEYRRLIKMIMRTRGQDPKLDKIWDKVKRVYSAYPVEVQAEEVFAAYAEQVGDKGKWAKAWDRVKEFIRLALGRIGLLPRGSTSSELDAAMNSIAKGFRSGTVEATVKQGMPFDTPRLYAMENAEADQDGKVQKTPSNMISKDEVGAAFKQIGGGIKKAAKAVMDDPKVALQYFWSLVKDNRRLFLKLVPHSAHNEIAKGLGFTTFQKFTDYIRKMNGYRNELQSVSDELADHWRSLMFKDRKNADKTTDLMYDTTLLGVDPSKDFKSYINIEKQRKEIKKLEQQILSTPGDARSDLNKKLKELNDELNLEIDRDKAYPDLVKRYKALPKQFQKLYTDVRDAYATRSKQWHIAQKLRIDTIFKTGAKNRRQELAQIERTYKERIATEPERAHANIKKWYKQELNKFRADYFKRSKSARVAKNEIDLAYNTRSKKGPYFPLSRFGDYFISVKTVPEPHPVTGELMDGDVIYFETFDNSMQMDLAKKEIEKKYGDTNKWHIQANAIMKNNDPAVYLGGKLAANVKVAIDDAMEQQGLDPELAADLKDQVTQFYFKSLPQVSTRKHQMHRKQREGFSRDAVRTFGHYMFHDSYQLARMVYTDRMRDQLDKITEEAKKLDTEMATYIAESATNRFEWVMAPKGSPFAAKLTSLGFIFYLGLAPAAALVNLIQTPAVALPHLASQYGYKAASEELLGALRDLRKGKGHIDGKDSGMTEDERKAFDQWVKEGLIDKTLAMDLAGIAEHGMEYSAVGFKVMQTFSVLFHGAERWNREVTALAAYRLAQKDLKNKPQTVETKRQMASSKATEAVETSHFVYDSANKAEFLQNDWLKVAFLFRQYGISMAWRLGRDAKQMFAGLTPEERAEAKTRLTGILGMSFLFTGSMGMPIYPVVETMMNALFDDEDEPYSFSLEFRKFLTDFVGEDVGAAIAHGPVQQLTGAGIAHRMSLANLFFMDDGRIRDNEDSAKYWLEQFAGPVFGIGKNFARGADMIGDGKVYRGVEYMLPKAFRDVMKAYRFNDEGARNLRGNPIQEEFSAVELFYQANGFIPAGLSERYERNNYIKGIDTRLTQRRSNLINLHSMGVREKDKPLIKEAKAKIAEWNRKHPEDPITQLNLTQSLGSRADYDKRVRDGIGFASKRLWLFDANNYLD